MTSINTKKSNEDISNKRSRDQINSNHNNNNHNDYNDITNGNNNGHKSSSSFKKSKTSESSPPTHNHNHNHQIILDSFRHGVLSDESAASVRETYINAKPYRHAVIPQLFNEQLLKLVSQELLQQVHATHKETDIYRVFQTGDLANLDGLPQDEKLKLQNLHRLRDAIYSEPFRRFMESVCGVGRLSPSKKDLSFNVYRDGCHLLCHDDVIGSRSVSFIIYLPDPSEPWALEDGGALELYPSVSRGVPDVNPAVVVAPAWNQIAFFAVQPGLSFHSVSEVVVAPPKDKTHIRPSIQGWFHVLQEEDMTEEERREAQNVVSKGHDDDDAAGGALGAATLEQLLNDETDFPFNPLPEIDWTPGQTTKKKTTSSNNDDDDDDEEVPPLTQSEIAYLAQYINPSYLRPSTIAQLTDRFLEDSSILMTEFLKPDVAKSLRSLTQDRDTLDGLVGRTPDGKRSANLPRHRGNINYSRGVYGDWIPTGPSSRQRLLELCDTSNHEPKPMHADDVEAMKDQLSRQISKLREDIFRSSAFRRFLYLVTGLKTIRKRARVRRFRPGMDYTLASSTNPPSDSGPSSNKEGNEDDRGATAADGVLDATLTFVNDSTPALQQVWESDDVGGFECYMAPDEGNADPAQYRSADHGDGGALLSVSAKSNTLSLVMRDAGVMKFIKYVSASAPGSRWDVAAEYRYK